MIRIEFQLELHYEIDAQGADFVFNVHAAQTPRQTVSGRYRSDYFVATAGLAFSVF